MSQSGEMHLYVITAKNADELSTPVFAVGEGDDEGVAVFTSRSRVEKYLAEAGWEDSDTIGELAPQAVSRWLFEVRRNGPSMLIVNPTRVGHEYGRPQDVIAIDELLTQFGATVLSRVSAKQDVSENAAVTERVPMHRLQPQ